MCGGAAMDVYALLGYVLRGSASLYLPFLLLPEEGFLAAVVLLLGGFCSWLPVYLFGKRDAADYL